jgi:Tol biopolymer transport system component
VTQLDNSRSEASHRWPFFLPDGRHFLFTARSFTVSNGAIFAGSIDSPEHKLILDLNTSAGYAPSGHLFFVRDRTLMAQRFNVKRLELEGDPVPLAEKVAYDFNFSKGDFSLSANGVLAYKQGTSASADTQIAWYDRTGKKLSDVTTTGTADFPTLSPNAKVAAFGSFDQNGWTIWLQDLVRNVKTRFSFSPASVGPVWSPDGKQIVFAVTKGDTSQLFIKPADGSRPEQPIAMEGISSSFVRVPLAWSPNGRYLLYREGKSGLPEIWALPMTGEPKPFPVAQVPNYHLLWADFSPDGKWFVYQSDESGRNQVYAAPFPGPGSRWQISSESGTQPLWRGNEVLFWNAGQMWAADIHAVGNGLQLGTPHALFVLPTASIMGQLRHSYDVTRDGKRFLISTGAQTQSGTPITLVLNWPEELKK